MLSDTLVEGLKEYRIGEKLRRLRLKKKMGLVELGQHTGLSPALLSKIERDKLFPTLPTLLRVALVFGVGLDHFFSGPRERPALAVVRAVDRKRFPDRPGVPEPAYTFECLDYPATERRLNAYFVEFHPVAASDAPPHQHEGAEVLYVIQGKVVITIGGEEYVLGAGDSIYFDPSPPHAYRAAGPRRATAIVVTT
ncbi:MAG TPA: cupin domain-containing protein [Vicinamibacterales bacterium]|nr:cupin domain-containing protein [Vicinamibacterales bacterium]